MEEIEYLEEYEDLILPTINSSSVEAKLPDNMANVPDDEDSSSIDQDIFESLFDDHSDDDHVVQKKVNPKVNPRRVERPSMDSIDMLVKDLVGDRLTRDGEQLESGKPKVSLNSANGPKKVMQKVHTSGTVTKTRPSTAKQESASSAIRADSSTRLGKPKSVATVRPTVQSQIQQKRVPSTKPPTSSHTVSSTQNSRMFSVVSSTSKGSSSVGLSTFSLRKQISVATSTTTAAESNRSDASTNVAKKLNRPQPTIIKPEKPQSRDPVEDPLSLDNINRPSDSDSESLSLSDISDDSFVSLSDVDEDGRNVIELSNDSSLERPNLDKIRGTTPSPTVSEDYKSDKDESPAKSSIQAVTSVDKSTEHTKVTTKCKERDPAKVKPICEEKSRAGCDRKSPPSISVNEFPERATVVSDIKLSPSASPSLQSVSQCGPTNDKQSGDVSDKLMETDVAVQAKNKVLATEQGENFKNTNKKDESIVETNGREPSSKRTVANFTEEATMQEKDEQKSFSDNTQEYRNDSTDQKNNGSNSLTDPSVGMIESRTETIASKQEVKNTEAIEKETNKQLGSDMKSEGDPKEEIKNGSKKPLEEDKEHKIKPNVAPFQQNEKCTDFSTNIEFSKISVILNKNDNEKSCPENTLGNPTEKSPIDNVKICTDQDKIVQDKSIRKPEGCTSKLSLSLTKNNINQGKDGIKCENVPSKDLNQFEAVEKHSEKLEEESSTTNHKENKNLKICVINESNVPPEAIKMPEENGDVIKKNLEQDNEDLQRENKRESKNTDSAKEENTTKEGNSREIKKTLRSVKEVNLAQKQKVVEVDKPRNDEKKIVNSKTADESFSEKEIMEKQNINIKNTQDIHNEKNDTAKNMTAITSRKLRPKGRDKESYTMTSPIQTEDTKEYVLLNRKSGGHIETAESEKQNLSSKAEILKMLDTSGEEDGLRRRLLRKRGSEYPSVNDKNKKMKNPDSVTKSKEQTGGVVSLKRIIKSPHKQGRQSLATSERHPNNSKEAIQHDKNNESGSELNLHKKSTELKEKVSQHKTIKPTTESKFENINKKNVAAYKSEKNKDGLLNVSELKKKPETTSIATKINYKISQSRDKCIEKHVSGNSKRDRPKVDEPPRKIPRLDPISKIPQNKEDFGLKEKSSPTSKNPKNKKTLVTPQTSPKKIARMDTKSHDTVKMDTEKQFDNKGLSVENAEIRHFTPEKRTQRLKAIDDRDPFKGFEEENESSNLEEVMFIKTGLDFQRKSPRVKNVEVERKKKVEKKQCDTSSAQTSVQNSSTLAVTNKEVEKLNEDSYDPKDQTKTSKNSPATKKSKLSPKKSPGSTVLTFSEWLNQRKIEDVEKSLEQLHEEHVKEQNKSIKMQETGGRSKDFNPKRSYEEKDTLTIAGASNSNSAKVANLSNEKRKRSYRVVRKTEAEKLKNEMPKEMRDSGIELLLQEKQPRKSVKSYHPNLSTVIRGTSSASSESNANTSSKEFKVPPAPHRSCTTPLRSANKTAAAYDNNAMGSGSIERDNKAKKGKLQATFKIRRVRIRLNRNAVACYFKQLKMMQPSYLENESCVGSIQYEKDTDETTSSVQAQALDDANSPLKATKRNVSVRSDLTALKKVTGPANVYTIPPHQRRAPPPVTISTASPLDETSTMEICVSDTSKHPMNEDQVETCLLTPIKHSTMQAVAAAVRKQQQQLHLEQRRQQLQQQSVQVSSSGNTQQPGTLLATTSKSTDPFTPIEPKEEVVDAIGENSSTSRPVGPLMISQSAVSRTDTSFGVAPAIIDSNGTRLYSFLHPAKYNRSHGNVLLDYCCPNLDGPMSAIDPTRIHTQVQTAVRELPAYIVMTTKLITRADLEANKNVVPASIRQKVEKITANAVTSATSASSGNTPSLPLQISAPLLKPSISALQKQLPPSTTITPKILPPNSSGIPSTAGVSANSTPPPLTPFSALANSQHIVQPSPQLPLTQYQRSLLRTQLRQFDARLKKHYSHIAVLTFGKRQEVIEGMVSSTSLTPKDVEMAVRLIDEYVTHISPVPSAINSSASQTQKPSQTNVTQKLKTLPVRSTTVTQQKKSEQQQLNRQVAIYDTEKNIIGYQYQMPSSSGATVTKSVMSTRSGVMSASPNVKLTSAASSCGNGTPVSSSKAPMQDSPRIFYAKSPMQTSTPIASSAGKTPMGSSITLKNTPRIGRDLTIRQVPSTTSTLATHSTGRLPPLTRNPHLSVVSTPVSRATHTVTTKSVTISSTAKRVTRKTAADAASKVIVVTQEGHIENDQSVDECILPDDNNGPEIKHEKVDDDFIGGN